MSRLADRTARLARRARDDTAAFDPPSDPPAEEEALGYLTDGVGEVVSTYVEARTGEFVRLTETEMTDLHRALNDWLALYARCYGRSVDPDVTVRTTAEVVLKTHSLRDTAQLLTSVPARGDAPGVGEDRHTHAVVGDGGDDTDTRATQTDGTH
ncbi:hypothetical protein [Salinirubrum litoreum]|uniref:DUF8055 domain-containing protein n=1 Tax=Salinirubrum litoreum TaxID=1126234 RepID=A0ABD5R809_9EURY|nr:hypothetical protein [Salinirubrum litoreum]